MSNVKVIYQRDMRAIRSSPFMILVFLSLCILPSLYTLINVRAIWNPYDTSEIKNIPVAVVNKDKGATLAGQKLNIGKTVVNTLKKDHQLNWKFVSAKTATSELHSGHYYAEIVIPKDFSKRLSSISGSDPHKAQLIYKANSRDSPMGGKITETAAKTLVNRVQTNFLETVNTTIFSKLNLLGNKAHSHQAEILKLKDWIITLSNSMDLATDALSKINQTSTNMTSILTGLKPVTTASQNMDVLQTTNTGTVSSLRSAQKTLNKAFTSLNTNLINANTSASRLDNTLKQLNSEVGSSNRSTVNRTLNRAVLQVDLLKGQIIPMQSFLKSVNIHSKFQGLTGLNNTLGNAVSLLNLIKKQLKSLKSTLSTTGKLTTSDISHSLISTQQITSNLNSALGQYNTSVKGHSNSISNNLISAVIKSQTILSELQQAKGINRDYLDNAIKENKLIASSTADLDTELTSYQDDIKTTANKLKLTSDSDMVSIITVLQNNPKVMGNMLVSLFNVKDESIYKVSSFGSAFLPTYLTLSIWIGCTMLVMVFRITIPRENRRFRNMTVHEEYFGKMLTFGTISLIQTTIIIFSAVILLHVQVESLFIMSLFGFLTSILFTTIVFTLTAIFGNLGKSGVIFLMALQLAGSGALYPIQLNPVFYRIVYRFFPFAYSVGGFREAVGGPNMETVFTDAFALLLMIIVTLLLGYFLKTRLQRFTRRIMSDFSNTGLGQ